MNNNRKIARKHTDNKEKIRAHVVIGRRHDGKRYAMERYKEDNKNETF